VNRRDFLCLRVTPRGRTLELSCRSLYMHYLDSESLGAADPESSVFDHEPWMGEPPAVFARRTAEALLSQVEDDLRDADVLRLLDGEWLAPTGLRDRIEPVLSAFRARGGRVEFGNSVEPGAAMNR
jgi:hypothetical protein